MEYNEFKAESSLQDDDGSDNSRSTNDLVFQMIEQEIGGVLDSANVERQNFMLICEWEGCTESFPLSQNPLFLHHMQNHVHEETDKVLEGKTDRFVCKWRGCTKQDEGIKQELEFARHLLYHPFHQKLKVKGLIALRTHEIYVPCQVFDNYRNLVPDFPTTIICQWAGCVFQCNCITSFDDHVRLHVYEQRFLEDTDKKKSHGNKSKPGKKGTTYYHCKWQGCQFNSSDVHQVLVHTQTHTNLRQFACARCGALFCTKDKFLDHHRRQATDGSGFILDNIVYQCTYCKKKYPSETILRNHMLSHIYNFMCQYCQNTFSKASGLRKHIIYRHRKERKFACQNKHCDYRAKDRYDLLKHVERTHGEREVFECKEGDCKHTCLNESTFQLHLKNKHSQNKKNYMCHVCNKLFMEGRTLSRHLVKIHDYSRPHGASKFRYTYDPDGFYRLQRVKYESTKLVAIKEIQKKAESSLLALGVSPNTNMNLVIRTESGEEQQLTFVSYRNALKELNSESQSDDGLMDDEEEMEEKDEKDVDVESEVEEEKDEKDVDVESEMKEKDVGVESDVESEVESEMESEMENVEEEKDVDVESDVESEVESEMESEMDNVEEEKDVDVESEVYVGSERSVKIDEDDSKDVKCHVHCKYEADNKLDVKFSRANS